MRSSQDLERKQTPEREKERKKSLRVHVNVCAKKSRIARGVPFQAAWALCTPAVYFAV